MRGTFAEVGRFRRRPLPTIVERSRGKQRLALSGPLGWWHTCLGAGLPNDQAVLVGARDLDPVQRQHLDAGTITAVPAGPGLGDRLAEALRGRPAYLHIDCDVLEPGTLLTDYSVPTGLTLDDIHACANALSLGDVIGVEIGEYEGDSAATAQPRSTVSLTRSR